jgi:hypothetical protein
MLLELRGDRPCGHPTLVGKPRLIHLAGASLFPARPSRVALASAGAFCARVVITHVDLSRRESSGGFSKRCPEIRVNQSANFDMLVIGVGDCVQRKGVAS